MGLFERFPYTNFHDFNLTWILIELKTLEHTINEFVSINALKYADPIQWNIVTQYEKNTIVIDPLTGTAYISVQPVPSGVSLTNTDYWTVVFDLGSFVVKAAKNFCSRYEEATTLTATFPSSVNDWLIWGDTLYYALVNITAGDSYVVDSNIKQFTVEDVVGHIQDLNTTDKSNLVAAINEVLLTAGDLNNLSTTDKSNLVAAINEVLTKLGDIDILTTTDKSSAVAAINELKAAIDIITDIPVDVTKHGVVGNGVTDDSAAFQDCVDNYDYLYIPYGVNILLDSTINITRSIKIEGSGSWGSTITMGTNSTKLFNIPARGVDISGITFSAADPTVSSILLDYTVGQGNLSECHFDGYYTAIRINNSSMMTFSNSFFEHGYNAGGAGVMIGDNQVCTGIILEGLRIWGDDNNHPNYGLLFNSVDGIDIIGCSINRCRVPFSMDPISGGIIHRVTISQTIFDICDEPALIYSKNGSSNILDILFNTCWFALDPSNNRPNILIDATDPVQSVTFTNCTFISGLFGIYVDSDVQMLNISNTNFMDVKDTAIYIKSQPTAIISNVNIGAAAAIHNQAPVNGIAIAGTSYNNRSILISGSTSVEATNLDIYTEVRENVYITPDNKFATGNNLNVGNTANIPTGRPEGSIYFNNQTNKAMFNIGGTFRTWDDPFIQSGLDSAVSSATASVVGSLYYATDTERFYRWDGTQFVDTVKITKGITADRPTGVLVRNGDIYFDTTINAELWFDGNGWNTY